MIINKKSIIKRGLPILIGAGLGYAYYYFIGCNSGACPISSNPFISTIYGGLIGLVWGFQGKKKNEQPENN